MEYIHVCVCVCIMNPKESRKRGKGEQIKHMEQIENKYQHERFKPNRTNNPIKCK